MRNPEKAVSCGPLAMSQKTLAQFSVHSGKHQDRNLEPAAEW
jgi:hypothetical protein